MKRLLALVAIAVLPLAGCAAMACRDFEGKPGYQACVSDHNRRMAIAMGAFNASMQRQRQERQQQQEENALAAREWERDREEQARLDQQREWQRQQEWNRMLWEQKQEMRLKY